MLQVALFDCCCQSRPVCADADSALQCKLASQATPRLRPLLQVLTFGTQNDEPEWVRKQFFLGVHGVIADNVAGVAAALSSSKVAM